MISEFIFGFMIVFASISEGQGIIRNDFNNDNFKGIVDSNDKTYKILSTQKDTVLTKSDSIKNSLITPKNLTECFKYLDIILKPRIENDSIFRNNVFGFWHFGTGLWIRNNWLGMDKELYRYFQSFNRIERDGISGFIERSYQEYLDGMITDPEKYMQENRRLPPKYICDGISVDVDSITKIGVNNIKDLNIVSTKNQFQLDIGLPRDSNLVFISTKRGWEKCDSILSNKFIFYDKLRDSISIDEIIYTYKAEIIKFYDLIGNENKILLSEMDNKIVIKIINKY
jgi:hypothetical protein